MLLPEEVGPVSCEQLVVGVLRVSLVEWRVSGIQNEKDDTKSEQVNNVSLVSLFHNQFWCHVGGCSQDSLKETTSVTSLDGGREAEVCESDIKFRVEHNVFWLQVTVSDSLDVHVVHHLEHLLEVVAANLLGEGAKRNVVEELSTGDQLEGHVGDWDLSSVRSGLDGVIFEVDKLDHVGVVKILVNINLVLESLHSFGAVGWVGLVEDFEGDAGSVGASCKLDLGRDSGAESLFAGVRVDGVRH